MSSPIETDEHEEDEINVNDDFILRDRAQPMHDNDFISHGRRTPLRDDEALARREYLANEILDGVGDASSLGCYRRIAQDCPPHLVFEALSLVKAAAREGTVRKSKGALFVDLVKRLCAASSISLRIGEQRKPNASAFADKMHRLGR